MTDAATADQLDQLDRVAALQRRREARAGSPHPASVSPPAASRAPRAAVGGGSKIAAAAAGVSAMLGLVAAMGWAARSSADSPPPAPAPAAPAQVVVVIHPGDGSTAQDGAATASPVTPGASGASGASGTTAVVPASDQPIVLSAQPTVRQAPASAAPTGRTNGSR